MYKHKTWNKGWRAGGLECQNEPEGGSTNKDDSDAVCLTDIQLLKQIIFLSYMSKEHREVYCDTIYMIII